MAEYVTVSIPRAMVERISELIQAFPEYGYRTHTEAIVEAVREKIWTLEKITQRDPSHGEWDRAQRGRAR